MFSAGLKNNWPDYIGIVWLAILSWLVYSAIWQIHQLVTKENLPFEDTFDSTRWVWIIFRSLGVFLLILAITNPFDITHFPNPNDDANRLVHKFDVFTAIILSHSGSAIVGIGILLCLAPMWRIRRAGPTSFSRTFRTRTGTVLCSVVALICLLLSMISSQQIHALIYFSVAGIDQSFATRFAGSSLIADVSDLQDARTQFSSACNRLAGFTAVAFTAFLMSTLCNGAKRFVCLITWAIGVVGAFLILKWVYAEGASSLSASWKFGTGVPDITAITAILFISVLGGFMVAVIFNRRRSANPVSLERSKLLSFSPLPILCVSIVFLVFAQLFFSLAWFPNGTMLDFVDRCFTPESPGPINDNVGRLLSSDFAFIWAAVFMLLSASHLNMHYWHKRNSDRFEYHTSSVSPADFSINWGVGTITLAVTALGLGWFSFASLISGTDWPLADSAERICYALDAWSLTLFCITSGSIFALAIVLAFQMCRRKKIR